MSGPVDIEFPLKILGMLMNAHEPCMVYAHLMFSTIRYILDQSLPINVDACNMYGPC